MKALSGRCLCGAVQFEATPTKQEMGVCHCSICRRWSGGTFMAVAVGDTLKVKDEIAVGVYASSPYGNRCFCKNCGSTLFWRANDGSMAVVAAQAFDDPSQFKFVSEIYVDNQPNNYSFANHTARMTEQEFVAAFMAAKGS